jgi:hypothetical protein
VSNCPLNMALNALEDWLRACVVSNVRLSYVVYHWYSEHFTTLRTLQPVDNPNPINSLSFVVELRLWRLSNINPKQVTLDTTPHHPYKVTRSIFSCVCYCTTGD